MNRIKNINNIGDLAIYDTVIRNHANILIKDKSIVDDIVNDVYIALDKYFKKYPEKIINGGFVSVMIRNLYKNYLKKITNKFDFGNGYDESPLPDIPLDTRELNEKEEKELLYDKLQSRIDKLSRKQQELLKDSLTSSILKLSRDTNKNYHKLLKEYHEIIKQLKQ